MVAPDSQTAGGSYVGFFPDILPKIPMGLRARLLQAPPTPTPSRTFNRITPTGEVEELLSYLPPDLAYSDWVNQTGFTGDS